jgi:hypothetical protein
VCLSSGFPLSLFDFPEFVSAPSAPAVGAIGPLRQDDSGPPRSRLTHGPDTPRTLGTPPPRPRCAPISPPPTSATSNTHIFTLLRPSTFPHSLLYHPTALLVLIVGRPLTNLTRFPLASTSPPRTPRVFSRLCLKYIIPVSVNCRVVKALPALAPQPPAR